jgi:hypothetical protein
MGYGGGPSGATTVPNGTITTAHGDATTTAAAHDSTTTATAPRTHAQCTRRRAQVPGHNQPHQHDDSAQRHHGDDARRRDNGTTTANDMAQRHDGAVRRTARRRRGQRAMTPHTRCRAQAPGCKSARLSRLVREIAKDLQDGPPLPVFTCRNSLLFNPITCLGEGFLFFTSNFKFTKLARSFRIFFSFLSFLYLFPFLTRYIFL